MTLESRIDDWSRGLRGPLVAAFIALLAGLPGLIGMPPLDRDESRFAQATAQMLETRDFVNIRFQDEPRYKKPIGIHWLQAISVSLFSDPADRQIWAYRLPSLFGAMLAAAAACWGARGFWGPRTGLVAGALLGSTFLLSTEAFIAKTDAALCGFTTLAVAALARLYAEHRGGPPARKRTRLFFWLGLAMATLIKGPVGPMVVILTCAALWAFDREASWLKRLGWGWGLILFFAIVGPWAMAITVATDGAFWGAAVSGDLAPKLAGGQETHGAFIGYHTLLVAFLVFPATMLLPAAAVRAWQDRAEPGVRFALCWLIPSWIVFELMPTKLPHYTLPVFGALAWLMASALKRPLTRPLLIAGVALSGLAALFYTVFCLYGLSQFGEGTDVIWAVLSVALFAAAAAVGGWLLFRQKTNAALVSAGALGILAHGAMAGGLAPHLEPLWLSSDLTRAITDAGLNPRQGVTPGPVEVAGYAEPSLVFALGTTTDLGDAQDAAAGIADGRPAIVESREEAAFRQALAAQRLTARPVATVKGVDYSKGDKMALTIYRGAPQTDVTPEPVP